MLTLINFLSVLKFQASLSRESNRAQQYHHSKITRGGLNHKPLAFTYGSTNVLMENIIPHAKFHYSILMLSISSGQFIWQIVRLHLINLMGKPANLKIQCQGGTKE